MKLKSIFLSACLLGFAAASFAQPSATAIDRNAEGQFVLPPLSFQPGALAPVISKATINLHYGKHFQAYINNLNKLKAGTPFEDSPIEEIVLYSTGPIFNNAGQALNHAIYFDTFSANPRKEPTGPLRAAILKKWGSLDKFKKEFEAAGNGVFGSGWVWLVAKPQGELLILTGSNADNPMTKGYIPLLGADVWEHAYYLDYQNRRADHLAALWQITDWGKIESRYPMSK